MALQTTSETLQTCHTNTAQHYTANRQTCTCGPAQGERTAASFLHDHGWPRSVWGRAEGQPAPAALKHPHDPATSRHTVIHTEESWLRAITGGADGVCVALLHGGDWAERVKEGPCRGSRGRSHCRLINMQIPHSFPSAVAVYQPAHDCKSSLTCVPLYCLCPQTPICVFFTLQLSN